MDKRTEDRLFKQLDKIVDKQAEMAVTLIVNTNSLIKHVKRTDLLEEKVKQHAKHQEKQLEEALIPIRWFKTTAKVIGTIGVIAGIVIGIIKLP